MMVMEDDDGEGEEEGRVGFVGWRRVKIYISCLLALCCCRRENFLLRCPFKKEKGKMLTIGSSKNVCSNKYTFSHQTNRVLLSAAFPCVSSAFSLNLTICVHLSQFFLML